MSRTPGITAAVVPAGLMLTALLWPTASRAVQVNLAAMSCEKYENELLAGTLPGYQTDSIDTVMWLFGFATAKRGERVMYGDSLRAFGFALDAECKNNPTQSLLDATAAVTSKRENPMDLTRLDCPTFETRHQNLQKSDAESATTLTQWLFGYAVGLAGGHVLDPEAVTKFDAGLAAHCAEQPGDSVYDALAAPNPAVPRAPGGRVAAPVSREPEKRRAGRDDADGDDALHPYMLVE